MNRCMERDGIEITTTYSQITVMCVLSQIDKVEAFIKAVFCKKIPAGRYLSVFSRDNVSREFGVIVLYVEGYSFPLPDILCLESEDIFDKYYT